jgi:hypothetical protein
MSHSDIYILSLCVKKNKSLATFHFKGVYKGNLIKEIKVTGGHFEKNSEYLLHVKVREIKNHVLITKLIRKKSLINH